MKPMKWPRHYDKPVFALTGAVMSTAALLLLSGAVGIAVAVLGCALCAYSLRRSLA
jgi:hypothetical protein